MKIKKKIHPKNNIMTVIMTNGVVYKTKTTLNKNLLKLELDTKSHSLWNKKSNMLFIDKKSQVAKFNKKFSNSNILNINKKK